MSLLRPGVIKQHKPNPTVGDGSKSHAVLVHIVREKNKIGLGLTLECFFNLKKKCFFNSQKNYHDHFFFVSFFFLLPFLLKKKKERENSGLGLSTIKGTRKAGGWGGGGHCEF